MFQQSGGYSISMYIRALGLQARRFEPHNAPTDEFTMINGVRPEQASVSAIF
jgi:hypothetical protein